MSEVHSDFAVAFGPPSRRRDDDGRPMATRVRAAGTLALPSGSLAVGDALTGLGRLSCPTGPLGPGPWPVEVAVVDLEDPVDERSTAARVRFADRPAVRWERADHGAGVDTGTVGFTDGADAERWMAEESDGDALIAALERSENGGTCAVAAGSWGGVAGVAFSSGWGDGVYDGFWGFDADGAVVEYVIDFHVLVTPVWARFPVPAPLAIGRVPLPAHAPDGAIAELLPASWLGRLQGWLGAAAPPARVRLSWRERPIYARWRRPDGQSVPVPGAYVGRASFEADLARPAGALEIDWVDHLLPAPPLAS